LLRAARSVGQRGFGVYLSYLVVSP
jgi:hypothetical protein